MVFMCYTIFIYLLELLLTTDVTRSIQHNSLFSSYSLSQIFIIKDPQVGFCISWDCSQWTKPDDTTFYVYLPNKNIKIYTFLFEYGGCTYIRTMYAPYSSEAFTPMNSHGLWIQENSRGTLGISMTTPP